MSIETQGLMSACNGSMRLEQDQRTKLHAQIRQIDGLMGNLTESRDALSAQLLTAVQPQEIAKLQQAIPSVTAEIGSLTALRTDLVEMLGSGNMSAPPTVHLSSAPPSSVAFHMSPGSSQQSFSPVLAEQDRVQNMPAPQTAHLPSVPSSSVAFHMSPANGSERSRIIVSPEQQGVDQLVAEVKDARNRFVNAPSPLKLPLAHDLLKATKKLPAEHRELKGECEQAVLAACAPQLDRIIDPGFPLEFHRVIQGFTKQVGEASSPQQVDAINASWTEYVRSFQTRVEKRVSFEQGTLQLNVLGLKQETPYSKAILTFQSEMRKKREALEEAQLPAGQLFENKMSEFTSRANSLLASDAQRLADEISQFVSEISPKLCPGVSLDPKTLQMSFDEGNVIETPYSATLSQLYNKLSFK